MDYDSLNSDSRKLLSSDSVQWQGTQTACAALDSLLSEAAFTPQSDSFKSSRVFAKEASRNLLHESLPSRTSSRPPTNVTASRLFASTGSSTVSNWNSSSNDHRTRQTRPSTSSVTDALPVGDPDQFLSMLKGISQRIDSNIHSDASTLRDNLRRRPPSKRIASSSSAAIRRAKHDSLSKSSSRSTSEGFDKAKGQEIGTWSYSSIDTDHLVGSSFRHPTSRNDQLGSVISDAMEVDPPSLSSKIMPPPPVPPLKATAITVARRDASCIPPPRPSTNPPYQSTKDRAASLSLDLASQSTLPSQTRSSPFPTSAPSATPKLHPLLENERKQRRLKLERTISASLASLPADRTPSPSQASPPLAPIPQQPSRPQSNHPVSQSLSQNRVNTSRPPPLGMRRTHTFPMHDQATSEPKVPPPSKQKSFRPPLLSSSQPSSTPSTMSSRSTAPPSHSNEHSYASSNTSPATSIDTPESKSGDENLEDLPLNSDADFSFGDAITLDVDMDALEETMRKYD